MANEIIEHFDNQNHVACKKLKDEGQSKNDGKDRKYVQEDYLAGIIFSRLSSNVPMFPPELLFKLGRLLKYIARI